CDAARRGDVTGVKSCGRDVCAQRKNAAGGFVVGDIFDLLREGEVGIAFQVTGLENYLLNMIAVRTNKFASEAIEGLAELSGAGGFVEFVGAWAKTAVDAIEENDGPIRMFR